MTILHTIVDWLRGGGNVIVLYKQHLPRVYTTRTAVGNEVVEFRRTFTALDNDPTVARRTVAR